MEFLIVTGMSGAGKSRAISALEDIGFFCVDNMPPKLTNKFAEIALQSGEKMSKIAVVTDVRGGELFDDFICELDLLYSLGIPYKLLFLDCKTQTLMTRYKETRRKHPLLVGDDLSLEHAIEKERRILANARARADFIIDTTLFSAIQLKESISKIFLNDIKSSMIINCISFGFKFGCPSDADLIFDVRCLPNPFYVSELKYKTGMSSEVSEYVMSFETAKKLMGKLIDLIDFLIPLYLSEGKSQLTIAFGCTGGKHRSVTFAQYLYNHLTNQNMRVCVNHRDIIR